MNLFCPIIRETCKQKECLFWRDGACLINTFLIHATKADRAESWSFEDNEKPPPIPDLLKSKSADDLAEDLVAFALSEFPEDENLYISRISDLFWGGIGVSETWELPSAIKLKMEKAEAKAELKLVQNREKKDQQKVEQEKLELPVLIQQCFEWSKTQNLRRLTRADVQVFLNERERKLMDFTERSLLSSVNLLLKTTK